MLCPYYDENTGGNFKQQLQMHEPVQRQHLCLRQIHNQAHICLSSYLCCTCKHVIGYKIEAAAMQVCAVGFMMAAEVTSGIRGSLRTQINKDTHSPRGRYLQADVSSSCFGYGSQSCRTMLCSLTSLS